jgi:acetolactate synthase I/II/III large subunit
MPKNINKVVQAQIPVLGDVTASMAELVPQIKFQERKEWFDKIKAWKSQFPFTYEPSAKGERMKPQEVVEELDRQAEAIGSECW